MRPARRQCDGPLVWQTRTKGVERGHAGAWLARIGVAYRVRSRAMLCGMPEEKKRIPWIAIVFAILALIAAFKASDRSYYEVMPMATNVQMDSARPSIAPSAEVYESDMMSSLQGMSAPRYYPYPGTGGVAASDTREFLKIFYSAQMKTRNVPRLVDAVESAVRGAKGRVDQSQSAREYGYVSFVVPMSQYEAFRDSVESLVGSRFIETDISSENLLPQKVSLEEQKKYVEDELASMRSERADLVSRHGRAVATLQSAIDSRVSEISVLSAERPTDPSRQAQITARILLLSSELVSLRSELADENSTYAENLSYTDDEIEYAQVTLGAVQDEDADLLESIATVSGSVSLQRVTLYEVAEAYLPGYSIALILAALSLISYYLHRRRVWYF